MIYNDGFQMNKDDQVLICPKCKNDEFSPRSEFCRICGARVYNKCEGEYDNDQYLVQHNSPGNTRFCEICGKLTYFFTEKFLKPWDNAQMIDNDEDYFSTKNEVAAASDGFKTSEPIADDDDLPF